jgi:DNA-directed RNA polymerase specialized sigma24 family protein
MKTELTGERLGSLLVALDADRERAGERYEELRRTLIRFFGWRNAPFPDEHADESLNRVARKLDEGVEIRDIPSYCYEVARLVFLEAVKGNDGRRDPLPSDYENTPAPDAAAEAIDHDLRLDCLDACLRTLTADSRQLIVEYYRDDKRGRIDARKALAAQLGLQREALANRAQRVRHKLEQCVNRCVRKKSAI